MAKEGFANWSDLKRILQSTDKNELIDIIRDFYEHPAENRQTIFSRHKNRRKERLGSWELPENYQEWVFPWKRAWRTSIWCNKNSSPWTIPKGSGDIFRDNGTTVLFCGKRCRICQWIWGIDEEFIDEGCDMLRKFCEFLKAPEGQRSYPNFKARLLKLRKRIDRNRLWIWRWYRLLCARCWGFFWRRSNMTIEIVSSIFYSSRVFCNSTSGFT